MQISNTDSPCHHLSTEKLQTSDTDFEELQNTPYQSFCKSQRPKAAGERMWPTTWWKPYKVAD